MSGEIQKDLRLPAGYKTWFQLARQVQSQDALIFQSNRDKVQIRAKHHFVNGDQRPPYSESQSFEADVITLKVRAFDELNELIPGVEDLFRLRESVIMGIVQSRMSPNPYDEPEVKLLDKLIQLHGR